MERRKTNILWKKDDFDEDTVKALEVMIKYGFQCRFML